MIMIMYVKYLVIGRSSISVNYYDYRLLPKMLLCALNV